MTRRFLVTGGAGYVGSHLVAALRDRGDTAVVLDNLSIGHREAVPSDVQLIEADLADAAAVDAALAQGPWMPSSTSLLGHKLASPCAIPCAI